MEESPCPLCQKKETVLRYTLSQKKIFWCRLCRTFFVDPFPSESSLSELYETSAAEFQSKYFESFQRLRSRSFTRGLETLSRFGRHPGEPRSPRFAGEAGRRGILLDIGTGLGFFLTQARRAGWEVEGLELSEKLSQYARQTLKLPVEVGTLDSAFLAKGRYDVITLWDVIEHLPDPKGALLRIRDLLVPRGVVVIRTPLCDSLIPRTLGLLYRLSFGRVRFGFEKLFSEHLFHFSEEGIRRLVERCGFRILEAYREDYIDPHTLPHKEWAQNPLVRLGANVAIFLSHLFHQEDEIVLYAEPSRP